MITVFNRRELMITLSMEEQMAARQCLSDAGVNYVLRTKNLKMCIRDRSKEK